MNRKQQLASPQLFEQPEFLDLVASWQQAQQAHAEANITFRELLYVNRDSWSDKDKEYILDETIEFIEGQIESFCEVGDLAQVDMIYDEELDMVPGIKEKYDIAGKSKSDVLQFARQNSSDKLLHFAVSSALGVYWLDRDDRNFRLDVESGEQNLKHFQENIVTLAGEPIVYTDGIEMRSGIVTGEGLSIDEEMGRLIIPSIVGSTFYAHPLFSEAIESTAFDVNPVPIMSASSVVRTLAEQFEKTRTRQETYRKPTILHEKIGSLEAHYFKNLAEDDNTPHDAVIAAKILNLSLISRGHNAGRIHELDQRK